MAEAMLLTAMEKSTNPIYGRAKSNDECIGELALENSSHDGVPMIFIWWANGDTPWAERKYTIKLCTSDWGSTPSTPTIVSWSELVAAVEAQDIARVCPFGRYFKRVNNAWMDALKKIAELKPITSPAKVDHSCVSFDDIEFEEEEPRGWDK
jgi:hypothetical protein